MTDEQELQEIKEEILLSFNTVNLEVACKRVLNKLKDMGYEQVWTKCPDCDGKGKFYATVGHGIVLPHAPCKGTGRIYKYVKWDREKVTEWLKKYCPKRNALTPNEVMTSTEMIIKRYGIDADKLKEILTE